jgi:hypothetical protein
MVPSVFIITFMSHFVHHEVLEISMNVWYGWSDELNYNSSMYKTLIDMKIINLEMIKAKINTWDQSN